MERPILQSIGTGAERDRHVLLRRPRDVQFQNNDTPLLDTTTKFAMKQYRNTFKYHYEKRLCEAADPMAGKLVPEVDGGCGRLDQHTLPILMKPQPLAHSKPSFGTAGAGAGRDRHVLLRRPRDVQFQNNDTPPLDTTTKFAMKQNLTRQN